MLYNQTIPSVIKFETSRITGPTTVNVKKPVMITESNGVNVKSTADGKCLWKNFSKIERIQTATNTGITWYVYGVCETYIPKRFQK